MFTEKANALCILAILKEDSDENHILGMKDIIAKMATVYGLKVDRRTVYSAIALLNDLNYFQIDFSFLWYEIIEKCPTTTF